MIGSVLEKAMGNPSPLPQNATGSKTIFASELTHMIFALDMEDWSLGGTATGENATL